MRKKVALLILMVGAVAVGAKMFGDVGKGPVPVEIHYLLPAGDSVEVVAAPVTGGPATATFSGSGAEAVSHTRLPGGDVDLAITLVAPSGARRTVHRTVTAERNAKIRIDLSREGP